MIRSLFKRSGLHFSGSLVSRIFTSTVYIVLSRFISPTEYGQATLVFTFVLLGSVVGDYGLSQWYQKQDNESQAFRSFLHLRLIFALISSFLLFFLATWLKWLPVPLAITASLLLIPHAVLSIASAHLIRAKEVLKPSLQQVIQAIPVLIVLFLRQHQVTVLEVASAYLIGDLIAVVLLFPRHELKELQGSRSPLFATFRSSSKYALLNYTSATYARADSVLVRGYLGEAALGFYGLAYRYLEYFAMLPSSLVQISFPIFARDKKLGKAHIIKITMLMACVGMFFSVFLALLAPIIITTFHGSLYSPAIIIMQILSATLFLLFINAPLSTYIQSSDMVKKFLPFGILNTSLNIALNIILIPLYGLQGAAWAMMITEGTGLMINGFFTYRLLTS